MSISNDSETKIEVQPEPSVDPPAAATTGGFAGLLRRWKSKELLKISSLGLRGLALFFSLVSFIVVVTNNHGDWKEFHQYQEYRYLLAVAFLSALYTGLQVFRQAHELFTGIYLLQNLLQPKFAGLIDFVGDQVFAYLLLSSVSSAIPLTDRMRESADNIFTDSSVAAISLSFIAFMFVASSAAISAYKLSIQIYV
ncbi:hypothetical protein VNO77_07358 [Canavalia gladiata]|uniref:CASP-like protein n=1 Tax=Canavalia gladiata TaxID=3824 RepID=A0AAN9M935_CANGL